MTMLKDVKVLDLTRLLPGPYCTWILSELGADVLKIEDPWEGDYARGTPLYDLINTGKKSLTINLKKDAGKKIFLELMLKSDVLVESFRPGVMDKLGLGYETLKEYNEKIIFCSISGYGQNGPYRDVPGHDINYMSISGLLGINRTAESPMIPGMPIADIGGGVFGALSILAGLYKRKIDGTGEYIDVSMTDVVSSFFTIAYRGLINETLLSGSLPCYNAYKTKDAKFLSVGTVEAKFWNNFCLKMNRDDLIQRQYDTSAIEEIKGIFLEKTREEWMEIFKGEDAMVTPIYSPDEAFDDPQTKYRKVFDREREILSFPVEFSENKTEGGKKAPEKGEDTSKILKELGYEERNIENLKEDGVI